MVRSNGVAAQRELIASEIQRADGSQDRVFQIAATLAAVAVAAGFVLFGDSGRSLDDWALLLVGAVPLLIANLYITQVALTIIADYYIRILEKAYPPHRTVQNGNITLPGQPMFRHLMAAMLSPRGASRSVATLIYIVGYLAAVAAVGLGIATSLSMSSPWWQFAGFATTVSLVVFGIRTAVVHVHQGRQTFERVYVHAIEGLRQPLRKVRSVHSEYKALGTYLAVPRPHEFMIKSIFFHLPAAVMGIAIAWRISGELKWSEAIQAITALVLAFELLIYQVRYMVNDWRGREAEPTNVYRTARGRPQLLIFDPERSKRRAVLFWTAGVLRLMAGLALAWACLGIAKPYIDLVLITIGATVLYESLRALTKVVTLKRRLLQAIIGSTILLVATFGYGARMWAGIAIGSSSQASASTQWVGLVCGCAIGFAGVVLAWTLYGDAYAKIQGGTLTIHSLILANSHLAWLAVLHQRAAVPGTPSWQRLQVDKRRMPARTVRNRANAHLVPLPPSRALRSLRAWASGLACGVAAAFWIVVADDLTDSIALPSLSEAGFVALGTTTGVLLVVAGSRAIGIVVSLCLATGVLLHWNEAVATLGALSMVIAVVAIATLRRQTYYEFVTPWTQYQLLFASLWSRVKQAFVELRT